MPNQHTFPVKDDDFNKYVNIVIPYLILNMLRLGVSAANQTLISGLLVSWNKNWGAFVDPSQHTLLITNDKIDLRNQLEKAIRSVYGDIPQSALTTDDRTTLGLPAHDTTHTRVPQMKSAPVMTLEATEHLQHTLRFQNPDTPDSSAMPAGQKIILEYFTGAQGLTDPNIAFGNDRNVLHFLANTTFTNAQVTQTCYYRCCYENTHGERSPWSATLVVVVG